MKEIKLVNGRGIALVDDEDYEMLMQYKWRLCANKYAETNVKVNKKWVSKMMHRLIMNEPKDLEIDHIDNDGFNNQKSNLRVVTTSQNQMNCKNRKDTSSKYKGVTWHICRQRWVSYITCRGIHYTMRRFKSEIDAALAYNEKAKELFGEFANLNIIEE